MATGSIGVQESATPSHQSAVTTAGGLDYQAIDTGFPVNTATQTIITSMPASTTVVAENLQRKGLILHNTSDAICMIKFGTAVTVLSGTFQLQPGDYWEMPEGAIFTGEITGIFTTVPAALTGLQVTEY